MRFRDGGNEGGRAGKNALTPALSQREREPSPRGFGSFENASFTLLKRELEYGRQNLQAVVSKPLSLGRGQGEGFLFSPGCALTPTLSQRERETF
jgi:hypothetical protein